MSTNPTDATKRSHPSVFSRSRTQAASRYLNSEVQREVQAPDGHRSRHRTRGNRRDD